MKTTMTAIVLGLTIFTMPAVAVTKTFSSAPLGSELALGGAVVTCSIYNAGSAPIVLAPRQILDAAGAAKAITADSCGAAALAPKKSCVIKHDPAPNNLVGNYVCRVKATGASVKIRGIAAVRLNAASILMTAPIE
jgi:hypothetical protein